MEETTNAGKTRQEPITIESLMDIWENQKIVPMIFKPTGEIVYVTPKVAQYIDKWKQKNVGCSSSPYS